MVLRDPPMKMAAPRLYLSDLTCWSAHKSPLPTSHPTGMAVNVEGGGQRARSREKFLKDTRVWGQESQPLRS